MRPLSAVATPPSDDDHATDELRSFGSAVSLVAAVDKALQTSTSFDAPHDNLNGTVAGALAVTGGAPQATVANVIASGAYWQKEERNGRAVVNQGRIRDSLRRGRDEPVSHAFHLRKSISWNRHLPLFLAT